MTQRGRRSWPTSLLENDDMLWEILVRLPPLPSSLPRASAVCKRWRRILTDPKSHRHFLAHHRSPPFLGVFECRDFDIMFNPALDPPDRIPPQRFDLQRYSNADYNNLLDCRHGLIFFEDQERQEVIVCDPITGEKHRVAVPSEFKPSFLAEPSLILPSAVLCAASDQGHVHVACHYSPFKVVLMSSKDNHLLVCVYSSETDTWGNHISTAVPCKIYNASYSGSLIGNTLYWLCTGDHILKFDLDGQSLPMIEGPLVANDLRNASRKIMPADNGDVGLAILSYPHFQMWQRDINYHGVMTWVLQKTIDISIILGLPPLIEGRPEEWKTIEEYTEDAIFICVGGSLYMVQLDSMQSKRLQESDNFFCYHPFTSFYAPGTTIKDGPSGENVACYTG